MLSVLHIKQVKLNLFKTQSEGFYMCNFRNNISTHSKAYHSQIFHYCHCNFDFLTIIELISSCNQFELYEQNKFNQFNI